MQVRASIKAGGLATNHNEGMKVRSSIKAGGFSVNHNEKLVTDCS